MKEGWTYKKLGEVANFISGYTPGKEEISTQGEYPYFKVAEMNIAGNELFMRNTSLFVNSPKRIYPKGSIIFPKNGGAIYTEKKRILEVDSVIDLNTEALYPTDQVELMYLFYLLTFTKISSFDKGGGLPSLDLKKMSASIIPVPPLSEQQSIVDYLDSAFAKIEAMKANAEKALNEAKALFQASLKEMLEPKEGWEEKTLKETAKYRRGSFPQPYGNKEWYDGEGSMPFVQVAELQEDSFNLISVTKRRISKLAQPLSVFVPAGTVLVSLQGSIGKVAITNYDSYVDRTVAIFQDYKIEIDKTFFAYQLKSRFEIERLKARGTTIKTITKEEFANFSINCPPLSEQQSIVATLDALKSKVDKLQENYDKISQECDALKQAILRQVFE